MNDPEQEKLNAELNPESMTTIRSSSQDEAIYAIRPDKREPAFRRYEPYIQRALNGPYTLDPRAEPGLAVSPKTFCARFMDAKLGFIDYGYQSVIPHTEAIKRQLSNVVARELANGRVRVFDKRRERSGSSMRILHTMQDVDKVLTAFDELKQGVIDILTIKLPEGPDDAKIAAIERMESHLLLPFGPEAFSPRIDPTGVEVVYTRRSSA